MAKATIWSVTDTEARKRGEQTGLPNRDGEGILAQGPAQQLARRRIERQLLGDLVELRLRHLERVEGFRSGLGDGHTHSSECPVGSREQF